MADTHEAATVHSRPDPNENVPAMLDVCFFPFHFQLGFAHWFSVGVCSHRRLDA